MPRPDEKPFAIPKSMVWEAWRRVKANKGAPGVDGEDLAQFEADLGDNLYKVWNRMSSGTWFPPPVMAVEIPKPHGGGVRLLGVRHSYRPGGLMKRRVSSIASCARWDLVVKAVEAVTDCRWVVLYVKRWLAAPLVRPDGAIEQRSKGTPQGSAVSPILANLFMHYAFDLWMTRNCAGR
jgi:retron-type reverse transcriptase